MMNKMVLSFDDRSWWEPLQVSWPVGETEHWKLEQFTVTAEAALLYNSSMALRLQNLLHESYEIDGLGIVPGTFTRLVRKEGNGHNIVFMSDTPAEIGAHLQFLHEAHDTALVSGLGLGVVVHGLLSGINGELIPGVDHVTVLEIDPEVIELVGTPLKACYGDRVEIICADAFTWRPPTGAAWQVAWHDIWPSLCEDNLPEMRKLKEKYRKRISYKQWCWGEDKCRQQRRHIQSLQRKIKKQGRWNDYQQWRKEQGLPEDEAL
jgi:hypothetical protein